MTGRASQRVVITGLGAITALGETRETTWARLIAGESGISAVQAWDTANYPTKIAGEIRGFEPRKHFSDRRARRLDRCHQLAIVAAREAIDDAGAKCFDPKRSGVIVGSSLGGMNSGLASLRNAMRRGRYKAHLLYRHPLQVCVDELTAEFGLLGPRSVISTACTASTIALAHAADVIRAGQADMVLTGGVDPLSELSFNGFSSMKNVSSQPCAPFSEPIGLSLGEGAAMMVLETLDGALDRGARIYAELVHYSLTTDAYHATSPDPTGQNQRRAVLEALRAAGIAVEDVEYVNAHGTGTAGNDITESRVLGLLFGERRAQVPVSSVKGALGHTLGAAGAIEALITTLAVSRDVVPPTANFVQPRQGCDLDYVPNQARNKRVNVAVSQNFAFGGNNAVVVIAKHDRPGARAAALANHRVVITGMGLVTPVGCGRDAFTAAIRACHTGIGPIEAFDTGGYFAHNAATVREDDVKPYLRSDRRRVDRIGLFTILGSELALRDAGIKVTRENAERIGVIAGTENGPTHTTRTFVRELVGGCPQKANPALFPNTVVNAGVGLAAINLRARGPNVALSVGAASGLVALCHAYELVRSGAADIIAAGGTDEVELTVFEAYAAAKRIAPYLATNGHRDEISCPFDMRRGGMILGEGAVFLTLESLESATARGAKIYAEVTGYHTCADRPVELGWDPSGEGMQRAMTTALNMASRDAASIGYVAAAAMSHPLHDAIEARALTGLFGSKGVPVAAMSSLLGSSSVTAPAALCAALIGMQSDFLPAGANYLSPDPECDLDVVHGEPRSQRFDAAVINAASLCGANASIVIERLS